NSYVNLKIATCLVRYADDRLIDQRFPIETPADIIFLPLPYFAHKNTPRARQKTVDLKTI
ncbi:hypothetical protein, partial [Burkholderia multivorans]|uniref:hypothetical protein n=1 Tax=Burkholderia multivorans TaxID=87883 RepID=UPI001C614647